MEAMSRERELGTDSASRAAATPRGHFCPRSGDFPAASACRRRAWSREPEQTLPLAVTALAPFRAGLRQINRHTMLSKFACKSLKTNDRYPHKVTHFFKGRAAEFFAFSILIGRSEGPHAA